MNEELVVLDASALLALLLAEAGSDRVGACLSRAAISAVNPAEVVSKLAERGVPENGIRAALDDLDLDIRSFDTNAAFKSGLLRVSTRALGLALGDRACVALAMQLGAKALTADRTWAGLNLQGFTMEMIC